MGILMTLCILSLTCRFRLTISSDAGCKDGRKLENCFEVDFYQVMLRIFLFLREWWFFSWGLPLILCCILGVTYLVTVYASLTLHFEKQRFNKSAVEGLSF